MAIKLDDGCIRMTRITGRARQDNRDVQLSLGRELKGSEPAPLLDLRGRHEQMLATVFGFFWLRIRLDRGGHVNPFECRVNDKIAGHDNGEHHC